jgi:hypothetical protein
VRDAILDGEIICLGRNGVSQFNQLLDRKAEPVLCAFDLLWLDGEDLRRFPLIDRKSRLHKLLQSGGGRILYAQHIEHRGKEFFQEVCARDLEGIAAKRKLGTRVSIPGPQQLAHSPVALSVCDVGGGGEVGLYSGLGLAGVFNCLIVFFGFFFSRPRLSRLPITCSFHHSASAWTCSPDSCTG